VGKQILNGKLSEYEKRFVKGMIERFSTNRRYVPTEKQMNLFVSLYRRQEQRNGGRDASKP
jgi:hypothetical protein